MDVPVAMPRLGESMADGTVNVWFKKVGDTVTENEDLFEVGTDKVDTEVAAPASGVVAAILVAEDETVAVGTVVAIISTAD